MAAVLSVVVVALAACESEPDPTLTPVPPTPTPTAAPTSTATAAPTSTATAVPTLVPTATPAPTPTPTPEPTTALSPDPVVNGGETLSDGDCPTDGSLDSAAAVASCSAAAVKELQSFSFEGVINLLALFPLGEAEGDISEAAMRLSGAMVLPDRISYRIDIGPEEEMASIAGVQIGMEVYVQDPASGLWFKEAPSESDSLEALQLVGMFMTPIDPGISLEGTANLDDGTSVYRLVSSQPALGSEALFLSGTGTSMTVLVGVADFLTREVRISTETADGEARDFIAISYHGYNEASEIEAPANFVELPEISTYVGVPGPPVVVSLTRSDDGDVEVMFNEPVIVEGSVELYVLDTATGGWGLPLLDGSGTDILTFDADAEGRPALVLGESQIAGFTFPDFDSNLVDAEGTRADLNFEVWTYE